MRRALLKTHGYVLTAPTAKSLTYSAAAQALVNAGSGTGTMLYKLGSGSWGTAIPSATNAGSYTVYYKASASTNYNESASGSVACSIAQKAISCSAPTAKSLTYNGSDQVLANAGSVTGGSMTYCLTSGGTYSSTMPTGKNAGSYTVWYKGSPDSSGNYSGSCSGSVACSIAKRAISCSAPTAKSLTYNGSAQALVNAGGVTAGTMYYKVGSGSYGTSIPTGTDAGSYTVSYSGTPDSNHSGSCNGTVNVTINCYSATGPTNKKPTYTGSAIAYANAGSTNHGTMVYCSTSGGTFTTSLPTATNAGSYECWWKVTGNTNVCNTAATKVACTIAKATCCSTAPTKKSLTYTGSAQALVNAGNSNCGTMQYCATSAGTYNTTIPTQTAPGTYTTYWKVSNDNNHSGTCSGSVTNSTIAKYTPTVVLTATDRAYNGSALYAVASVSKPTNGKTIKGTIYYGKTQASTTYSISYTGSGNVSLSNVSVTNTGSTTVWAFFVPDSTCNDVYNQSGNASKTMTISKAPIICSAPTAKSLTYNGSDQALANAGSVTGGSMTYCLTSGGTYSSTMPTGKNVGSYTVWYKGSPDSSGNYSGSCSGSVACSIAKKTGCTISFATTAVTKTYGNAAFRNAITNSGDGTITWSSNNTTIATVNTTGKVTIKQASSCTINATTTSTTNCTYSTTAASYTLTVNKADGSVTTAPTPKTGLVYTGRAQELVSAGSGTGTMLYKVGSGSWGTSIPTATNAASYTVYYKASASTNYNESATASTSMTIAKAQTECTIPTAKSLTYNGSDQTLSTGGAVVGGYMTYCSTSGGTYTTSIPTGKNAGSYKVWYKSVINNGNYSGSCSGSVACSIAKRALSYLAPTAKSLTYNGNAQALVNAGSVADGTMYYKVGSGSYGTSIPTGTNAGSYTVSYSGTPDSNHSGSCSGTVACSIAKADGSVTTAPTAKSLTYNGSAQALVNAGSGTGTMLYKLGSGSWGTSIPTATNAGSYTVYYKASASTNYNESASGSVSTTIAQKSIVCTAPTAKSLTYNGSDQSLTTAGSVVGGTMYYMLGSGSYIPTIPTAKNAGSYTVQYKAIVDSSGNYSGSCSGTVACSIAKAACCSTAPTAKSLKYNGSAQALVNAGSSSCGTMQYSTASTGTYSTTIPTKTDAGTYTTYWKVSNDSNHSGTCSGSVSTTIGKSLINVNVTAEPNGCSNDRCGRNGAVAYAVSFLSSTTVNRCAFSLTTRKYYTDSTTDDDTNSFNSYRSDYGLVPSLYCICNEKKAELISGITMLSVSLTSAYSGTTSLNVNNFDLQVNFTAVIPVKGYVKLKINSRVTGATTFTPSIDICVASYNDSNCQGGYTELFRLNKNTAYSIVGWDGTYAYICNIPVTINTASHIQSDHSTDLMVYSPDVQYDTDGDQFVIGSTNKEAGIMSDTSTSKYCDDDSHPWLWNAWYGFSNGDIADPWC